MQCLSWLLLILSLIVSATLSTSLSFSSVVSPTGDNDDDIEDSLFDPIQADPDCLENKDISGNEAKTTSYCNHPPDSTIELEEFLLDTVEMDGDDSSYDETTKTCPISSSTEEATPVAPSKQKVVGDKHWGRDPVVLKMRDQLRYSGLGVDTNNTHHRPPIFLIPGLAATRLVNWRFKSCFHALLSDIKVQDSVWLNLNLFLQMSTINATCLRDCLRLGHYQSDYFTYREEGTEETDQSNSDAINTTTSRSHTARTIDGCKLRPDEGLDAIASLSPGGLHHFLVGGTNTVYAWLIQWLADHLGYDVNTIIGLPYDWRLSPDYMERRDGFFTHMKKRLEAAVQSNGRPGIVVAHSMGNLILRYFLSWLLRQLQHEAYTDLIKQAVKKKTTQQQTQNNAFLSPQGWVHARVMANEEDKQGAPGNGNKTSSSSSHLSSPLPPLTSLSAQLSPVYRVQLWELAIQQGKDCYIEWLETHIWTYVGLSAPLLGAVNPLRSVLSGENMGLPVPSDIARVIELSFGSTHTVNPVSTQAAFCDDWTTAVTTEQWEEASNKEKQMLSKHDTRLACLDDVFTDIEYSNHSNRDPWEHFPVLRSLLKERHDWNSQFDMIKVVEESCSIKEKSPCADIQTLARFGPKDVQSGYLFERMSELWKERDNPLLVKKAQLAESFWNSPVINMLNHTWERPLIKHVIMAYGVDIHTEVGYIYAKTVRNYSDDEAKNVVADDYDGIPTIQTAIWESAGGILEDERVDSSRSSFADMILTKNKKKRSNKRPSNFRHSGDGSVPYLSLSWAHTWLLHAVRATRYMNDNDSDNYLVGNKNNNNKNPLDDIEISHRPKSAMEWINGPPPRLPTHNNDSSLESKKFEESSDTGTAHPHGTKYKPAMVRYHNQGTSRTTGIDYTTTVIEAIGVEHKETTRNYDILAAVFTDVLKFMHDDNG